MMQSRTHTCGQIRLANAGEKVTLCGWMENVRVVGQNFAFVVLRDFYGTTQIVVETEDMMNIIKSINKESTIQVTGTVPPNRTGPSPSLFFRTTTASTERLRRFAIAGIDMTPH